MDWSCDTCIRSNLDSSLDAGLEGIIGQLQNFIQDARSRFYQGGGDARISDQEIGVRSTRHSHECAHLLDKQTPILPPSSFVVAARSGALVVMWFSVGLQNF
jgi:hypothetical protein